MKNKINVEFFSLSWISPLLKSGYENTLDENDLYNPLADQESHRLTEQLEEYYDLFIQTLN